MMRYFYQLDVAARSALLTAFFLANTTALFLIIERVRQGKGSWRVLWDLGFFALLVGDTIFLLQAHMKLADNPALLPDQVQPGPYHHVAGHLALLATALFWLIHGLIREKKRNQHALSPSAIKEALDNLPGGLCVFSNPGMLYLSNRTMRSLARQITGRRLLNGRLFWQQLTEPATQAGVSRIAHMATPVFALADGRIWQFDRQSFQTGGAVYNEIRATEITERYRLSQTLSLQNETLASYQKRIEDLLANITQVNRQEERLAYQMLIHDELGRCVQATRRHLVQPGPDGQRDQILASWRQVIVVLNSDQPVFPRPSERPLDELMKVAAVLGCQIQLTGRGQLQTSPLVIRSIREALVNAVRHAGADQLKVAYTQEQGWVHLHLSDNGQLGVKNLVEGGGLSSLRQMIEQAGGQLAVSWQTGVQLTVTLPEG